jgi:hypothetical protein
MIVLFLCAHLFPATPSVSASNFWPIPLVLKHEFVGTKQGCLKGNLKRIAQFLIIQGDNRIAVVPFVLVMKVSQLYRLKLHNLDPVQ